MILTTFPTVLSSARIFPDFILGGALKSDEIKLVVCDIYKMTHHFKLL